MSVRPDCTVTFVADAFADRMAGLLVTPAEGMTTLSVAVGTAFKCQLAAVCQSVLSLPSQVKVGAWMTRHWENSEVFGASAVVGAVTTWPTVVKAGSVTLKVPWPSSRVEIIVEPKPRTLRSSR